MCYGWQDTISEHESEMEEMREGEEIDEVLSDDYKVSPCGRLGAKTCVVQDGEFLGEFNTTEDALQFIK